MDKIGMVVNYFRKSPSDNRLNVISLSTELGLVMLRNNQLIGNIILVDGSHCPDEALRSSCSTLNVQYLHAGRELSIPEAYNLGWHSLTEPYIGLMANDILTYDENTVTKLLVYLKKSDVGCVYPYISEGDWPLQNWRFFKWFEKTCEPSFILLNLIFFKRSVLEEIGGVEEDYKWGYYDPILLLNIRKKGFRVILVGNTKVIHLGMLTKNMGESYIEYPELLKDEKKFKEKYPEYYYKPNLKDNFFDAYWPYKFWKWPFSMTLPMRFLWWFVKHIPNTRLRNLFIKFTLYIEPVLTQTPR